MNFGMISFAYLLFSRSVVSNSLWPHGLQHTRLPCPSPSPGACSNSCPLSWWCHPTILSSVVPFYSCLQSFPASGSFLKSLLQCHSSKTSILQCSAFFMVHFSHPYRTTGKTIYGPLSARWYLLFNTLSGFVSSFSSRSKYLLISWLQSPSLVILEPKKIVSLQIFPVYLPWRMGPDARIFIFLMFSFKPALKWVDGEGSIF